MSDAPVTNVEVNISKLLIGDLELIALFQQEGLSEEKQNKTVMRNLTPLLDMLDRVVVGGARGLPYTALAAVMKAVGAAFEKAGNPDGPTGN